MRNLYVSAAPHIKTKETTTSIMRDVVISLIPALIAGVLFFGYRALAVVLTAVAASVLSEYVYNRVAKKTQTVNDLSAVVTGVLIGLNMPPSIPLWMVVIGSAFAIIIVKQLYGGLGRNFLNPALAARCFMLIAWTNEMTMFVAPFDAVTSATPLAVMSGAAEGTLPSITEAFLGVKGGCIGETSGLALLIGFIYLVVRRVVRLDTPISYILTFFVLTFAFGEFGNTARFDYSVMQLLTGGLLLGAFFMATDYVTTPTTPLGHVIFGIGCGVLTFVIRRFGGYPEGVSFSILLMNVVSPIIETYTMPKAFGHGKEARK